MKMLTCKEATRLISERGERPFGFRELWGLRLHLVICQYCRRFAQQLAAIRQAARELGRRTERDVEGADLSPEARQRIRKALTQRSEENNP